MGLRFSSSTVTIGALVVVAGVILAVGSAKSGPLHTTCLQVQADGKPRLFFGSPGAVQASSVKCSFEFEADAVHFNFNRLSYAAKLTPPPDGSTLDEADQIQITDGSTTRCHQAGSQLLPGGSLTCKLSFWQLVPNFNGTLLRLEHGRDVSAYGLVAK